MTPVYTYNPTGTHNIHTARPMYTGIKSDARRAAIMRDMIRAMRRATLDRAIALALACVASPVQARYIRTVARCEARIMRNAGILATFATEPDAAMTVGMAREAYALSTVTRFDAATGTYHDEPRFNVN